MAKTNRYRSGSIKISVVCNFDKDGDCDGTHSLRAWMGHQCDEFSIGGPLDLASLARDADKARDDMRDGNWDENDTDPSCKSWGMRDVGQSTAYLRKTLVQQ